jgi:hypothetical protein
MKLFSNLIMATPLDLARISKFNEGDYLFG